MPVVVMLAKAGGVVLTSLPYAAALYPEHRTRLCGVCGAGAGGRAGRGCRDCGGGVVWCSRACQVAGEEQHDWECGLLDREGEGELSATALLLLRLWLRSTHQPEVGEQVLMGQGWKSVVKPNCRCRGPGSCAGSPTCCPTRRRSCGIRGRCGTFPRTGRCCSRCWPPRPARRTGATLYRSLVFPYIHT